MSLGDNGFDLSISAALCIANLVSNIKTTQGIKALLKLDKKQKQPLAMSNELIENLCTFLPLDHAEYRHGLRVSDGVLTVGAKVIG